MKKTFLSGINSTYCKYCYALPFLFPADLLLPLPTVVLPVPLKNQAICCFQYSSLAAVSSHPTSLSFIQY